MAPCQTGGNEARASDTGGYWYGVQAESGSNNRGKRIINHVKLNIAKIKSDLTKKR